ncbi:NAD(P)-binding protein [Trichoderma novae-zelandiae]
MAPSLPKTVNSGPSLVGTAVAVGKHIRRFTPSDRVVRAMFQDFIGGRFKPSAALSTLRGALDVTFRTALFGLSDYRYTVIAGKWVLTQVCKKAVGARVIATTGSREKVTTAKAVTGGEGVDHDVEVSGPVPMAQSLSKTRTAGVSDALTNRCIVQPVAVGSRTMLQDLTCAIEANPETLRPVIHSRVFRPDQLKEGCGYQVVQAA